MKIFIGPSGVDVDLSGFDVRPPAQQGDIASAVLEGKDTLILIDGYFMHTLSPWHKEILFAISKGCRVIGAASLGALRAVECNRYGMEGAGEIYEWYKDGTCIDDADVAVAHTEGNYDNVSVPIVNLIATVNALNDKSLINIIKDCRRIYYPERSWGKIKHNFGTEMYDLLKSNYINQKSLDTVKAIELSKTYPAVKRERSNNVMNSHMISLLENDISINGKRKWQNVTHKDDSMDLHLIAEMAAKLGVQPSINEIDAQSTLMWENLGINDPKNAVAWMKENNVSGEQWNMFAIKRALRQSARDWHESVTAGLRYTPIALEYQLLNDL